MVAAPPYYARLIPQPMQVIEAWGLGFHLGNAIKYIARAGHKGSDTATLDLQKAISYIGRYIEVLSAKGA